MAAALLNFSGRQDQIISHKVLRYCVAGKRRRAETWTDIHTNSCQYSWKARAYLAFPSTTLTTPQCTFPTVRIISFGRQNVTSGTTLRITILQWKVTASWPQGEDTISSALLFYYLSSQGDIRSARCHPTQ